MEGQKGVEALIPQKSIEDQGVYAELNKFPLTLPEGISPNNVYLTLLALYVMKAEYGDRAQELSLIARKAVAWLQSIGLREPDRVLRAFTQIPVAFPACREVTMEEARANPGFR